LKVLVDTSAWADFLNDFASPVAVTLSELLRGDDDVCTCGIVVAEVFQGLRREKGRDGIRQSFGELTFLEPAGIGLYLRAAELHRLLRARGRTVRSTIDCIIVAIAEENGAYLLARDGDIDAILESGLVRTRAWPA